MKHLISSLTILFLFFSPLFYSQKPVTGNSHSSPQGDPIRTYLNLNNISTVFKNDGISDINVNQSNSGFVFPKGSGRTAVFTSGLIWGAFIPGDPQVRVGGTTYATGLQGGKILSPGVAENPNAPHVRIYRVRPDVYPGGPFVDLSVEANDEGRSQAEVRAQYEIDWVEWRAQDGAPYLDGNNNGQYDPDPFSNDVPGIEGANQTVWFVANDLNATLTTNLYGAQPIGVEMQATIWEYKNSLFLDNLFFRKYKLINKSTTPFNDMYISMWSDIDLGNATDDYIGTDISLNMVYSINAYDIDATYIPYPPPAIGFGLMKGPSVAGNVNLPMTASYYFVRGVAAFTDPPLAVIEGSTQFYNFMQGLIGSTGEPFIDPTNGQTTTFPLNGDPLTEQGWIDGILYPPGDRRCGFASGPFQMAIGDTQEIVIAEIAAIGIDRLNALRLLKFYDVLAQDSYDTGIIIPSPPKPPKPIITVDDADWKINLDWSGDSSSVAMIENFNQGGYSFQGYNVYQLSSHLSIKQNVVRITTFDKVDGVTTIPGIVMDPETGLPVNGIQQFGGDYGIKRVFSTNYDYIENSRMLVGKRYYFAVTAYTYNSNPQANPNNSESVLSLVSAVYYDSLPGAGHGDIVKVVHTQGNGDDNIVVTVYDPTKLTGDDYEVFFETQQQIRDENGDWVPASTTVRNFNPDDPDTLTGSTITAAAVYGPNAGTTELRFHLDVVHHYYGWVDGVILTFPANVTIISSPPFEAGGGTVLPEIIGQEIHYGVTDNSGTGNGIFHEGGEDWIVIVDQLNDILPVTIEWTAFDDGYAGGGPPLDGTTTVAEIGFESRLAYLWNLLDVTLGKMVLEHESVYNGIDLFPPRDDAPTMVENPIVDGLQINMDISYGSPVTIGSLELNGNPLASNSFPPYGIQDYAVFGAVPATAANSSLGVGTDLLELLQKDYELIFTGTREIINIGGINVEITSEGGGSIATLYGARRYDIGIHPLNPNPGSSEPFTIRIPFEVWSIDEGRQVNIMIYDRIGDPSVDDPFRVWNTEDRMYTAFVLTEYQETPYSLDDPELAEFATWNLVWWVNQYNAGDVLNVYYDNPIIPGQDRFAFTAPDMVVSVEDDESLPLSFRLFQNYPNPFNPSTIIRFNLPEQEIVKLDVYDILGQRVAQLVNRELQAGKHEIEFNGRNLVSGIYFYRLKAGEFTETKKMILLK